MIRILYSIIKKGRISLLAKLNVNTRQFIKVYYDFIKSKQLTSNEKSVFTVLKSFAGTKNECYPSLNTIADLANLCKRTIQNIIKSLESKNVITVKHRKKEDGGHTSNLYILYDYAEMWEVDTNEERKEIQESIQEKEYIDMLESKGYKIIKENDENKKPDDMSDEELINLLKTKGYKIISENDKTIEDTSNENYTNTFETTKDNNTTENSEQTEKITEEIIENKIIDINRENKDNIQKGKNIFGNEKEPEKIASPTKSAITSSSFQNNYINNFTPNLDKCQVKEAYKLDEIRQIFDYSEMLNEYPIYKKEIDTALNVIYDVVNTQKATVRIGSEDKPKDIVISKFMKLTGKYIVYAISKFMFNETKVKHQISYMRTLLYNAAEQYELEKQNDKSMERNSTHNT